MVRKIKFGIPQAVCSNNTLKSYRAEAAQGDTTKKGNRAAKQPPSPSKGLTCPESELFIPTTRMSCETRRCSSPKLCRLNFRKASLSGNPMPSVHLQPRQPAATARAYLFDEVIDCRGTAVHLRDIIQAAPVGNARFAWKERPGCSEDTHRPSLGSSRHWVLETLHPVKVMKPRTTAQQTAPRGGSQPHPELLFRTKNPFETHCPSAQ